MAPAGGDGAGGGGRRRFRRRSGRTDPRELALEGQRRVLEDRHRGPQVLQLAAVALVTEQQRLVPLQDLVRQAAEPGGQATGDVVEARRPHQRVFARAPRQSLELVVLGVHKRRDRLQVHDQPRLEVHRRFHLARQVGNRRVDRGGDRAFARHAAVHVIDQLGVEPLLRREHRLHDPPHRGRHPGAPARRAPAGGQDLPALIERGDLLLVRTGRWMGQFRQPLHGRIDRAQGLVVAEVRGFSLGLQAREILG